MEKSSKPPDVALQVLEFALLNLYLALAQYFTTISLFLPFGTVMYILCQWYVEVCNLLYEFTGVKIKRLPLNIRRDFELLHCVDIDYANF